MTSDATAIDYSVDKLASTHLRARMSDAVLTHIESLVSGYDAPSITMFRALMEGDAEVMYNNSSEAAGYLHTAAVAAPVLAHVIPLMGAHGRTVDAPCAVYDLSKMLQGYWGTKPDAMQLDCVRRQTVARGTLFRHLISPMTSLPPSARLDVLYQWIGTYFATLSEEMLGHVLDEGNYSVASLMEALDGDYDMINYGHDHRMSFLTDSELEAFGNEMREAYDAPDITNEEIVGDKGVLLSLEYWKYMDMRANRAGYSGEDYPAWNLARLLFSENDMSHFGVVTMLADFDVALVQHLLLRCASYTATEKHVIALVLSWGTNRVDMDMLLDISRMVERSAIVAPMIAKFYDAGGFEDDQAGNDALTENLESCYGINCSDEVNESEALGKLLFLYITWMRDFGQVVATPTTEDFIWMGEHAIELSEHAGVLLDKCDFDRESFEQMLSFPALADGVL